MLLAVKDVTLGHLVIPFSHKRFLDLILNLLNRNAVVNVQPAQNVGHHFRRGERPASHKGLCHRIPDFFNGKGLSFPVTLDNKNIVNHTKRFKN